MIWETRIVRIVRNVRETRVTKKPIICGFSVPWIMRATRAIRYTKYKGYLLCEITRVIRDYGYPSITGKLNPHKLHKLVTSITLHTTFQITLILIP